MAGYLFKLKILFYSGKENPFVILTSQEQSEIILLLKKQKYLVDTDFLPELGDVGFIINDLNNEYEVYQTRTVNTDSQGIRYVSDTTSHLFTNLISLFQKKYAGGDDFLKQILSK